MLDVYEYLPLKDFISANCFQSHRRLALKHVVDCGVQPNLPTFQWLTVLVIIFTVKSVALNVKLYEISAVFKFKVDLFGKFGSMVEQIPQSRFQLVNFTNLDFRVDYVIWSTSHLTFLLLLFNSLEFVLWHKFSQPK